MTKEREALQMCLEFIETNAHERRHVRWAIKEALAQPEQERNFCPRCGKRTADLTTIHTCTPPQENTEPCCQQYDTCLKACTPRGTHLAQRTWVGLTDEEIQECYSEAYKIVQGRQLEIAFYKTIEAKLKEKNT